MDQVVVVVVVLSRQRNTARSLLLLLRLVFPLVLGRRLRVLLLAANVKGIPITCRVITFFWMRRGYGYRIFLFTLSRWPDESDHKLLFIISFYWLFFKNFSLVLLDRIFGFDSNIVYNNLKRGIIINSGFVVQRHLWFQIETTRR